MPRVGVHAEERLGGFLVELSYSRDERAWMLNVLHEDNHQIGYQWSGDEHAMRNMLAGVVAGIRFANQAAGESPRHTVTLIKPWTLRGLTFPTGTHLWSVCPGVWSWQIPGGSHGQSAYDGTPGGHDV